MKKTYKLFSDTHISVSYILYLGVCVCVRVPTISPEAWICSSPLAWRAFMLCWLCSHTHSKRSMLNIKAVHLSLFSISHPLLPFHCPWTQTPSLTVFSLHFFFFFFFQCCHSANQVSAPCPWYFLFLSEATMTLREYVGDEGRRRSRTAIYSRKNLSQ